MQFAGDLALKPPPIPTPEASYSMTNCFKKFGKASTSSFVRKLSPAELKDCKDKGLCFNSDNKFSLGHRCKKLSWIEGVYEEDPQP
jgi:hypothetical protein